MNGPADPGVASLIPAQSHTFMEIDHEIISTVILIPSAHSVKKPGSVVQSVVCLATDACLTADPGVASSIPVRSHTFMDFNHEMISTVILLPSADSFKKVSCKFFTLVVFQRPNGC